MYDPEISALVIQEHDFQEAKNSLKRFTEQAKDQIEISAVPTDGGFLWLGDHKVTGAELNNVISQIQGQFISLNQLGQGLVDEFGQVYKAFESLDKDYISGIVSSIKAAEKVSRAEQEDRATLKKTVKMLCCFQKELEKLKHLMDVDKLWETIEQEKWLLEVLDGYQAELSALKHLSDIDKMWEDGIAQAKKIDLLNKKINEYHITIDKAFTAQGKAISELSIRIDTIQTNQQAFMDSTSQNISKYQASINQRVYKCEKSIQQNLDAVKKDFSKQQNALGEKVNLHLKAQNERLEVLNKAQIERIDQVIRSQDIYFTSLQKSQADTLEQIATAQAEELKQFQEEQTVRIDQVSQEQMDQLSEMNKSLEEEKTVLNDKVTSLLQKVKISYAVAGGAAVLTILQLLLNLAGII